MMYEKEKQEQMYSSFVEMVAPEIDVTELFKKEEITPEQVQHELESFKKVKFKPTFLGKIDMELKQKIYDSMKGHN